MRLRQWLVEKLNPAQPDISLDHGGSESGFKPYTVIRAYKDLPAVRRGVDMLVDGCASLNYDILDKINGISPTVNGVRKQKLGNLLNFKPNPYQDASRFRRTIFMDLILEGNIFLYWDGAYMYHLPAEHVTVESDPKTFVRKYVYNRGTEFTPDEIIHIMDNSADSIFRGSSRLTSVLSTLDLRGKMTNFQDNFFKNNAVMGLVVESPNILGDKVKTRFIDSWIAEYNPARGGKRPMILDGGMKLNTIAKADFRELDFEESLKEKDKQVLTALGIPPILLEGGNNANIAPNLRLFYLETVIPIVNKLCSALELFFGYDIKPEASGVSAVQPDLREVSAYFSTLVNAGLITVNEGRDGLRYDRVDEEAANTLRVPQNITGSAANPSEGGRPPKDPEED